MAGIQPLRHSDSFPSYETQREPGSRGVNQGELEDCMNGAREAGKRDEQTERDAIDREKASEMMMLEHVLLTFCCENSVSRRP